MWLRAQADRRAGWTLSVTVPGSDSVSHGVLTTGLISAGSRRIGDAFSKIDGVASQTRIPVLLGAVEVVHAGDQRLGFALLTGDKRSAEPVHEFGAPASASLDKVDSGDRSGKKQTSQQRNSEGWLPGFRPIVSPANDHPMHCHPPIPNRVVSQRSSIQYQRLRSGN